MKTTKKYNRILQISDDAQQITLPDARYYKRNGEYYPSITYVLSCYPKGKFFQDWLKKVGYSADWIVKKAADEGTQVHEMCEDYLNGKELNFLEHGIPMYDPNVWQMFLRFVDWWETYKPTLLETEVHLFSDKIKVAGTCDLVCEIEGEVWVIDFKTSNNLQTIYELQTAIYAECYKECFNKMADRQGILWLKSSKRGPKEGKIQGKGWELFESKRTHEENIDIFQTVKKLFDLENPKHSPIFTEFRTQVRKKP
jgi:ATP-dependent exoDNAse (exonuclease V) beta subunit